MKARDLVARGLVYYWRTHLAVVGGIAVAVAVLAGALLVGDSVRGSLRDLVLERLGQTDRVILSTGFVREQLIDDLRASRAFGEEVRSIAPLLIARGLVTHPDTGRVARDVQVYGVDDRFWTFHQVADATGPSGRTALASPALAAELGASKGDVVLVRVQRPSDLPLESLYGRKDNLGLTSRVTLSDVLAASRMGAFSLMPNQSDVLAVFVSLARLQEDLGVPGRVNALLVASPPGGSKQGLESLVRASATPDDLELTTRVLNGPAVVDVGSRSGLLDDAMAAAVESALTGLGLQPHPLLTYLANGLSNSRGEVPYSLVTATDLSTFGVTASGGDAPAIVLNDWAASDLAVRVGDSVTMRYFAWEDPGLLTERSSDFHVAAIVPVAAGDRDMAPSYPGITDSPTLGDWDPPFPIDLRLVRPVDERYWEQYRTTPKAFIALEVGQELWRSRYGAITSVRVAALPGTGLAETGDQVASALRRALDPLSAGLAVRDVRAEGLSASQGATDFGAYFLAFSIFLIVAALTLVSLFFKLGIEQRVREVGLLRAVGFGPAIVQRLFTLEGLLIAVSGSVLGAFGAVGYAALLMKALSTWWVDAVGTSALELHVVPLSLVAGVAGGIVAASLCIWWTLRSLRHVSDRTLLSGEPASAWAGAPGSGGRRRQILAALFAVIGAAMAVSGVAGLIPDAGAFFGAGSALMVAALVALSAWLRRPTTKLVHRRGWLSLAALGIRAAGHRPSRSVVAVAVLASATFMIVSIDTFRRSAEPTASRNSGLGGYHLIVKTLLPVVNDPNSREGREALNLTSLDSVTFEPFRVLPGDDASCLNLYQPTSPRILAPRDSFLSEGRFAFQASAAASESERANPWLLLQRREPDGAVPVIADANSMTYVLHRQVGDTMVIPRGASHITVRFVAALRDSIFQSELLMSEGNFLRLFPEQEGANVLLADLGQNEPGGVVATIENALVDFGGDVVTTADQLAAFHRVENTYLNTFQALGGFGLLLGSIGLATVLLRNVLERRRELALLGAVGYRAQDVLLMVLIEHVMLLVFGLLIGVLCAGVAVLPGALDRGLRIPWSAGAVMVVLAVLFVGLFSSALAAWAATRTPVLDALRSE